MGHEDRQPKLPCFFEFSRGNGSGVAEAIGNWGFSNNKVSQSGQELTRLRCLYQKMDSLRTRNPRTRVKYDRRNDPEAWRVKPSPEECKPAWNFPRNRPLITYDSTATVIKTGNMVRVGADLAHVIPGRSYVLQGTNKWYRRAEEGGHCPQPSCLAPTCPRT